MKIKIALLLISISFFGCSRDYVSQGKSTFLVVQIDYKTYKFEGASEQVLYSDFTAADTLPLTVNYIPPADFGNVAFNYQPKNELVFDGSIIWMGTGQLKFPAIKSASNFSRGSQVAVRPDTTGFQFLQPAVLPQNYDLDSIWMDIADLKIVNEYLKSHKKVGIFLYTPSVGVGNPADWNWYLFFNK